MTQTPPGRIPRTRGLEYIELRDFTPGIFSDLFSNPQNAPDGALQEEGTWGCVSSPNGGLLPGPRKIKIMRQPFIDADTDQYLLGEPARLHVLGFRNAAPTLPNGTGAQAIVDFPDTVYIYFQWYYFNGTTWRRRVRGRVYRPCFSSTRPVYSAGFVMNFDNPSAGFGPPFDVDTADVNTGFALNDFYGLRFGTASIDLTRVNKAAPTIPGQISFVSCYYPGESSGTAGVHLVYPDPDSPGVDGSEPTGMTNNIETVFAHQGRVVGLRSLANVTQLGTGGFGPAEYFEYTNVNNTSVATTTGTTFVEENPSGWGVFASMNASELFMVKRRGGAAAVRGDIANPQVVRLPGVEPTGYFANWPIVCPLGCVYGAESGVWLWTGGDTSQCISTQLDGPFWVVGDDERIGHYGRFGYMHPYVFSPNNYIMDTRTGGWFRLAESPQYSFWESSSNGNMLGVPFYIEAATNNEACGWWDVRRGTNEYRARTQPLGRTQNRILRFRELVLRARGRGTITFTVHRLDGSTTPEPYVVKVNNDKPIVQRIDIADQVIDAVVDIHSVAEDANESAPILDWCAFGYNEGAQV